MEGQTTIEHGNIPNESTNALIKNFDTVMHDINQMMMHQMSLTMKTFVDSNQQISDSLNKNSDKLLNYIVEKLIPAFKIGPQGRSNQLGRKTEFLNNLKYGNVHILSR